ncbi:MAG: rhamnogalacturonan lyase, partial [Muribaculaceae bacterium]|nr:rhamnogalacturonan lyase [Muribaculaceae bacterium]
MRKTAIAALMLTAASASWAQYSHTVNADNLGRGVLAVKADKGVFVSWRSLPTDDSNLAFDIYRDGVKVNDAPLSKMTNFTDPDGTVDSRYIVKAMLNGEEKDVASANNVWASDFMKIHLDRPEGGTSKPGGAKEQREYTYTPDDVSVGDVDGDGEFEFIVKWFPTNAADNSHTRFTGNTIIDCYKLDGTKLWRIDLGHNIRSGNHYTQFMVYDFDGDGKAELICKTAPGTIDGMGKAVLMDDDKETDDYRKSDGTVMSGPEYLTVFNGLTGAEINTIAYNPPRSIRKNDKSSTGWGDNYGNRSERYLAGVAYLDGVKPSAVFVRGYYTASYVWAVDFDGKELKERWLHKSETAGANSIYGQGTHSLSIADLDGDGFDEVIIGSGAIDHDGSFLHSTGGGHGDALHVGDFILENEGLEIFMPHEDKSGKYATSLRDGKTGKVLYYQSNPGKDIGRGLIANVSSKYSGSEYWSTLDGNVMNAGKVVGSRRPSV